MINCLTFINQELTLNLTKLKDKEIDYLLTLNNPEIPLIKFIKLLKKYCIKEDINPEKTTQINLINISNKYSLGYHDRTHLYFLNLNQEKTKYPLNKILDKIHSSWTPTFIN